MGVPLLKTKHEGTVQVISDGTGIRWQTMRDLRKAIEELLKPQAMSTPGRCRHREEG